MVIDPLQDLLIFKNFSNKTSFFVSKTHRFYEFILVDIESVQISHIKNPDDTNIAHSKCKILKIISEKDWEQNPFTHKRFFLKILFHKPLII